MRSAGRTKKKPIPGVFTKTALGANFLLKKIA